MDVKAYTSVVLLRPDRKCTTTFSQVFVNVKKKARKTKTYLHLTSSSLGEILLKSKAIKCYG